MAGIFSLGGGGNTNPQQEEIPPLDSLYWNNNKNDDVSSYHRGGGFELWNQQQFMGQGHPPSQARPLFHQDLYSALGVGPARPIPDDQSDSRSGFMLGRSTSGGSGSAGGISCQDCGNQAKKDCPHMRCRTCCKSRGFDCHTHVKSTWVPASRRRERQQQQQQLTALQQNLEPSSGDLPKRHRERDHQLSSSSPLACTRLPSNPSSTGLDESNFPSLVRSAAEFKCVRVSAMEEEAEEEYAYSTTVNIAGRVFKGILYDHGREPEGNTNYMGHGGAGESSSTGLAEPLVDPSSMYPAPLNSFMPGSSSGTQFFPHPRS